MNKNTKFTKYNCTRCASPLHLYANYYFTVKAEIDSDTGNINEPTIGKVYKMEAFQGLFQCAQCGIVLDESNLSRYTNIADKVGANYLSKVFPSNEHFQIVKKTKGYRFYKDAQFKNLESELENLKSRIRDSSSFEDLRDLVRYVGATEEEELEAEKRIKRIDEIYDKYGDELPPDIQYELDRLNEQQDEFEYKYC